MSILWLYVTGLGLSVLCALVGVYFYSRNERKKMMKSPVTDVLAPYRKVLAELAGLAVEWTVASNGEGGVRSRDNRCPLKELWYLRTGEDRMPSSEEVGFEAGQLKTFTSAADGCYKDHSETLREAILRATVG